LRPVIKALEEQMDELALKIAEEAGRIYPAYNRLVGELNNNDSPSGKEALAELMAYVDFNSPLRSS